MGEDWVISAV